MAYCDGLRAGRKESQANVSAEREACAALAEKSGVELHNGLADPEHVTAAIRARSTKVAAWCEKHIRARGETISSPSSAILQEQLKEIRDLNENLAKAETGAEVSRREKLGRLVREVWVEWANEQPCPKGSWLLPWERLSDPDREVDMRIGERLIAVAAELCETRAKNEKDYNFGGQGKKYALPYEIAAEEIRLLASPEPVFRRQ